MSARHAFVAFCGKHAPQNSHPPARTSPLGQTHTLTRILSFRGRLPGQGLPAEWRRLGRKAVDRDSRPGLWIPALPPGMTATRRFVCNGMGETARLLAMADCCDVPGSGHHIGRPTR